MPRPYDCVRRAWHSERHQPIRGILIHEIFRVVNEIHSCATKKNKEYLEKLPVVVLRAEEIMYSKANSEAEYMDLTTLLDRTNDAIDTIIRRDEHTETGQYLQPCIEAALSLGCSISKASRSQHSSPRCYLRMLCENVASTSKKQCLEHRQPSKLFSVYPLYYGNHIQFDKPQHGFRVSHKCVSNTSGPAVVAVAQNPSSQGSQSFIMNGDPDNPCTNKCDLSLRLGPLTIPAPSFENGRVQETEVRSKLIVGTSQKGKKVELPG